MRSAILLLVLAELLDSGSCFSAPSPLCTVPPPHHTRPGVVHAVAPLPTLPTLAAVCVFPTCLGFWKSEYGVSYAYGIVTATVGALVLRAAPTRLVAAHALSQQASCAMVSVKV